MKTLSSVVMLVVFGMVSASHLLAYRGLTLNSSLMYQQQDRYVYFPGMPAVLRNSATAEQRRFRIEQYYNYPLPSHKFHIRVMGPWADTIENVLRKTVDGAFLANQFIKIAKTNCDQETSKYGYRCLTDFYVSTKIPTGTLGISIGISLNGEEYNHSNSVFWLIIPDESADNTVRVELPEQPGIASPEAGEDSLQSQAYVEISKSIVQISLQKNFSIGSGFLTRSVDSFKNLFPAYFENFQSSDNQNIYIVTAAHIFPIPYEISDSFNEPQTQVLFRHFPNSLVYDLKIAGKSLPKAAMVIAKNVEADVAILKVKQEFHADIATAIGAVDPSQINGLVISRNPLTVTQDHLSVYGFPANIRGNLARREGQLTLNDMITEDTSNFGPLKKFKLNALNLSIAPVAEPGMSGGPVINAMGEVVGIAIERPVQSNSLIALDLTSVENIKDQSSVTAANCYLHYHPYLKLLKINNHAADCHYGNFGSKEIFGSLLGSWVFQEVLALVDSFSNQDHQHSLMASGHAIINGHAIISGLNGNAIINGHAIIAGEKIADNTFEDVNGALKQSGFQLNPDSFKSFKTIGIRVLHVGDDHCSNFNSIGRLISKVRADGSSEFQKVYNLRQFTIWLHKNICNPDLEQLIYSE